MKKYIPEILTIVLISGLCFALWTQTNRLNAAKNEAQAVQLAFDQYRVEQQAEINQLNQQHREALQNVSTKAQENLQQALEDERHASAVALNERNRVYNREIARLRQACNSTPATGDHDASDPIGVLAHVLARTDQAAGIYARVADERGIALNACIEAYEAVRETPNK